MKINLSPRLQAVAAMVIPGKPCADIGTDHGRLPIYLAVNEICPKVIASDKADSSLAPARDLVKLLDLEGKIETRMGDGLTVLFPKEVATIVLAGMGANTIRDILKGHDEVTHTAQRLVLQPQRATPRLRLYLAKSGWCIIKEDIVHDGEFFYEIMAAEKGRMELSGVEAEFGPLLLKDNHPLLKDLLLHKRSVLTGIVQTLEDDMGPEAKMRKLYLLEEIKKIDIILLQKFAQ